MIPKYTLYWRVVQAEKRTAPSHLCMKFKSVIKDMGSCIFKEQQLKEHNRNHCPCFPKGGELSFRVVLHILSLAIN